MITQSVESISQPTNDATLPAATQILGEEFAGTFSHHTAKVNGIDMHYVSGGHGVPIVFIHGCQLRLGFGSLARLWRSRGDFD